jgi:hypothetical protein
MQRESTRELKSNEKTRNSENRLKCFDFTYRTSRFVVVQVHFLTQWTSSFAGVDKFPGEFVAKNDIIGASTPFLFEAQTEKHKNMKHENGTWSN